MVKRSLLAAQRGDGVKTIAGLCTVRVGRRAVDSNVGAVVVDGNNSAASTNAAVLSGRSATSATVPSGRSTTSAAAPSTLPPIDGAKKRKNDTDASAKAKRIKTVNTTKSESQKQRQPRQQQRQEVRADNQQQTQQQQEQSSAESQNAAPFATPTMRGTKRSLIDSIYGQEEAAKKRRIMERKSLDKVTSVREAFEVCFFKAEKSQADGRRNQQQLQQALTTLDQLRRSRAKLTDITRVEEQVRQLRAKITNARASQQTPIDVLVNVAKFSKANCCDTDEQSKEPQQQQRQPQQQQQQQQQANEIHRETGTVAALCIGNVLSLLQTYADSIGREQNAVQTCVGLPPLRYNVENRFASDMARQICDWDLFDSPNWVLFTAANRPANKADVGSINNSNNQYNDDKDDDDDDKDDDDDDKDDEDDVFDDGARNQWYQQHGSIEERLIELAPTVEHCDSHTWSQATDISRQLQSVVAKQVAERLVSLFFKANGANVGRNNVENNSSTTSGTINDRQPKDADKRFAANNSNKAISVVRIGHLEKSAAIGGKSRNRVRNKMKPARNTENVSIMNFLRVQMHEMSDKHVEAAKFIEFMQAFERQHGDTGPHSGDSMFSTFANKQQQQPPIADQPGPAPKSIVGVKRKRTDASVMGDCGNAAEALPLPNYSSPQCRFCNAPVHVSSRTGMETCTSPLCAATVYMATGFDVVHLEQQVHNTYQYLLAVHMKSTLRRVQGKESAMVPKRIKDAVRNRLLMERANLQQLTAKKVKLVLKKLDLSAWYNHRHKICAAITGRKPYQFSAEEEDVILAVFERLIEPYNLYRPKTDENFPYYRYALHKILQLLGYPDEVLRDFPILKARKNHRRKEQIWEKMMLYRGWPYYKS